MPARSRVVAGISKVFTRPRRAPLGRLGPVHYQTRSADEAPILEAAFEHDAVVAHPLAVVVGEEDDGVLGEVDFIKCVEGAADGVVDHGHHAVGQFDDLTRLALEDGEGCVGAALVLGLR